MRVGSLFSGIGGLDCGLARAGFRHAFLCESDSWRRGVLGERFPGVPVYDDVRGVRLAERRGRTPQLRGGADASEVAGTGPVDLLCGGFPCQDLSVAGRRAGLQAGERSSLFFEFARVADELVQPGGYVLIENVPGLLSSQGGRDFALVLATLAELGFHDLAWRVLDSRYFGVPQRRRRVFVLGRRASGDRCAQILLEPESGGGDPAAGGEAGTRATPSSVAGTLNGGNDGAGRRSEFDPNLVIPALTTRAGNTQDDQQAQQLIVASTMTSGGENPGGRRKEDDYNLVAYPLARRGRVGGSELEMGEEGTYNALRAGDGGSSRLNQVLTGTVRSHPRPGSNTSSEVLDGAAVRRLTPVECERLQALPDGWTEVPDGAPDSRRYAGLGDAVTASVGEWIGRRLLEVEARQAAA